MRLETEEYYRGIRMVPYDLIKEALVAFGVVLVTVVVLAAAFSSPDVPPLTIRQVAQESPLMFLRVALGDLDGSGDIASYGPPYNGGTGSVQYLGPISLQELAGIHFPINTPQDFVVAPLHEVARYDVRLSRALAVFQAAAPQQQRAWEKAYGGALAMAPVHEQAVSIPKGNYGPVATMMADLLSMGQSGALDGFLLTSSHFYQTDYTKPLLFIQGDPLHAEASAMHLLGTQWGMMNETGSYPGQAWIWLYTFWYQIPPFSTSPNGDAYVWLTIAVLTLALILVPFTPGLNRLPRYLGVYKLIWRNYYRERVTARRQQQR
ncbi:MAG TPA: hypothetical protein VKV57_16350 [bacterium]|nr:hypothetical protein [bacterium]